MSAAKHTPGPWYVRKVNGPAHDPERFMPAVSKMGLGVPPTLANARLIAAAPDLLEALERLLASGDVRDAGEAGALKQARAAIAKATGGAA